MNCLRVARAAAIHVLEANADAEIAMFAVWIDIIATDDAEGAQRAVRVLPDSRVQHFYDLERHVGHALAPRLGLKSMREIVERTNSDMESVEKAFHPGFVHGPAALFDTVLFYPKGARWTESGAAHASYVTQLDPSLYLDVDRERFRYGDELEQELRKLASELLAPVPKEPDTTE